MDISKSPKDIRIRNVSLHRRGKAENGTLYLTRHHLIFSYVPDAKIPRNKADKENSSGSRAASGTHIPALSTETSKLSISLPSDDAQASRESHDGAHAASNEAGAQMASGEPKSKDSNTPPRAKPKEIWVPYPMINSCVLRPAHATSQALRHSDGDTRSDPRDSGEDAFPPSFGTNASSRPSTESFHSGSFSSPKRTASPAPPAAPVTLGNESGRPPAIRIRRRDFAMMAFHFHKSTSDRTTDELAREVLYALRSRCCVDQLSDMHAFHFKAPPEESAMEDIAYDPRREFARMGIGSKAAEGPGSAWRISDINQDYQFSATYPKVLCVPREVSDNMLKYGGPFRSKSRIPALTYLHSNGGSITRSSQPMVGIQGKRSPQDERLVSAIFSSHTPLSSPEDSPPQLPSLPLSSAMTLEPATPEQAGQDSEIPSLPISQSDTALDETSESVLVPRPRLRIYGSTRRSIIADARPKINILANRAMGGGIEDAANYTGANGGPVEKVLLNIDNIHAMRSSLEKVIDSFANSDYLDLKPNHELLRKSGWLGYIATLLDSADMTAKAVGLGGSHVLVHCSDGWDRTSQVAALAEVMLDPHYRTLRGFMTLVQKDFLSFGHKFQDRHGIMGCEKWFEIENERVVPSQARNVSNPEFSPANTLSAKALSGAKNWFEKRGSSLFRQQNGRSSLDASALKSESLPPNPVLHSPPTLNTNQEKDHNVNEKEIAPIFHQFLDAVFQLQHQNPDAFQFNERFLRRLFYQAYAGQYGEFLFDTEKHRSKHESDTPSVWAHFLSREHEFLNLGYMPKTDDPFLFPRRQPHNQEIEVRWWSSLFGREDEEMNTPRSLAPPDPEPKVVPQLGMQPSALSLDDGMSISSGMPSDGDMVSENRIKEARSVPNLGTLRDARPSQISSMYTRDGEVKASNGDISLSSKRPPIQHKETDRAASERYTNRERLAQGADAKVAGDLAVEGDPLGVSGSTIPQLQNSRLDFAAFAKQSAFSER